MTTLRTFQAWSDLGFRIRKGAHHVDRDELNMPLFDDSQVYRPGFYDADFDREDDAEEADFYGINPWGS